jgi:hypothetical protein
MQQMNLLQNIPNLYGDLANRGRQRPCNKNIQSYRLHHAKRTNPKYAVELENKMVLDFKNYARQVISNHTKDTNRDMVQ